MRNSTGAPTDIYSSVPTKNGSGKGIGKRAEKGGRK